MPCIPGHRFLILGNGRDLGVDPSHQGWSIPLQITPLVWAVTIAVTIALFVYEFLAHVRKPHAPSMGESARWSAFYIGLALLFGGFRLLRGDQRDDVGQGTGRGPVDGGEG